MNIQLNRLNHLPDSSRVWIYQSDRPFSEEEVQFLEHNMERFIHTWAAHGKELFADFEVVTPYFLIVAVDDSKVPPSGCSIDASVHFIQDIQKHLKNDFFNRLNVVYYNEGKMTLDPVDELVEKINHHNFSEKVVVFDNLITNLGELKKNWTKAVEDTWIASRLN